jgi:hypothetical protein
MARQRTVDGGVNGETGGKVDCAGPPLGRCFQMAAKREMPVMETGRREIVAWWEKTASHRWPARLKGCREERYQIWCVAAERRVRERKLGLGRNDGLLTGFILSFGTLAQY